MFKTMLVIFILVGIWAIFGESCWLVRELPSGIDNIARRMPDRLDYYTPPIILALLLVKRTK
jgi:hypothetical protein